MKKNLIPRSALRIPHVVALLFLAACVPVPPSMLPQAPTASPTTISYPDVDPSGTTTSSLHFSIHGYQPNDIQQATRAAEDIYNKIGIDTGLYSYLAGQTFTLILYRDQAEYMEKTKQPASSRATSAGTVAYTYTGPEMTPALAHHLTHAVLQAYLGDKGPSSWAWLREGLALHEEMEWLPESEKVAFHTAQNNKLRTERKSFSEMAFYVGGDEEKRKSDVWYLQSESAASFLLKAGNSLAFSAFLNELRNGSDLDHALSNNYAGRFRGTADFQTAWESSL